MSEADERVPWYGVVALMATSAFVTWGIVVTWHHVGHEQLGSDGHVCFANKTCRDNLVCKWDKDGLPDGVCLKP